MAKETKVGLLAGLAFIICFAVILANRGAEDSAASRAPFLPDGRGAVPGSVRQSASRTTPHLQRNGSSGSRADGRAPGFAPTAEPRRTDQVAPSEAPGSGAELVFSDPGSATRRSDVPALADRPTGRPSASAGGRRGAGHNVHPTMQSSPESAATTLRDVAEPLPQMPRQAPDAATRQRELEQRLAAAGGSMTTGATTNATEAATSGHTPVRSDLPARQSARAATAPAHREDSHPRQSQSGDGEGIGASYTVVSGDTLSKIAAAHYGSKAHRFANAIFNANRALLADPDTIKVGMVLTIPALEEAGGLRPAETSSAARTLGRPTAREHASEDGSQRPFRWYQVKKNDRYSSIAREQLGSVGRWRELFELNKDKFPNPDVIREGVRIKLPPSQAVTP